MSEEIVLIVDPRTDTVEVSDGETAVFDTKTETIEVTRTISVPEETIVFDIESETIVVVGEEVRTYDMRTEVIEIRDGGPSETRIFQGPGSSGLVPDPLTSTGRFLRDDGTWGTGGGGGGGATDVFDGPISGVINGINAVFTLSQAPSPATSLQLFKNGMRMKRGAGRDYQLSGLTITFESDAIPSTGATLTADYQI